MDLLHNPDKALTDFEKEIKIPELIAVLKQTNEGRKITGKKLCDYFNRNGYALSQQRLCLWISYIRQMNLVAPYALVGVQRGYLLTQNPELIRQQIESLIGRIAAMKNVIDSLSAQRENLIKKSQAAT